jgi:hypothetical protein
MRLVSRLLVLILFLPLPAPLAAQRPGFGASFSGRAIAAYTHVDPIPGGTSLNEIRIVQPVAMLQAHAWGGRLSFLATANLEGWTMPDGELTPAAWGEGFVDRRHPHTYFHELMLSADDLFGTLDGQLRVSLSGGKGFVAFGSDDPMSRPTLRYPVNHHFSQILERYVAIGGIALGPVMVEGTLFNGDEPENPEQWPVADRFGDSWSVRGTVMPVHGVEVQLSRAGVHSPEHRPGAGPEQVKWNASARLDRLVGHIPAYALLEWARTAEADGFFVYESYLLEAQVTPGRHRPYYRFERTERPEEERTLDPFRSRRPHLEDSIFGITRWTVHTLGYGYSVKQTAGGLGIEPFVEVSRATPESLAGLFQPAPFYGDTSIWSGSIGLRVDWRMAGHRMGRYGVADDLPNHHM